MVKDLKQALAVLSIFLAFLIVPGAEFVLANPVAMPVVNVQSPINNQNYPTNDVELKAMAYAISSSINFSLTYYILDDQQAVSTNGTTILSGLSAGSHTLKLYGIRSVFDVYTNSTKSIEELGSVVYFSVVYPTQWVILTVILVLVLAITSLVLFKKRGQIKAALERPKRDVFYFGAVLLFFSSIFIILFGWQISDFYLFPYWPLGMVFVPILPFIISVFFLLLGLTLTWFGVHKKSASPMPKTL
jgi:hypothetical protein